jgi:hypothetical protein
MRSLILADRRSMRRGTNGRRNSRIMLVRSGPTSRRANWQSRSPRPRRKTSRSRPRNPNRRDGVRPYANPRRPSSAVPLQRRNRRLRPRWRPQAPPNPPHRLNPRRKSLRRSPRPNPPHRLSRNLKMRPLRLRRGDARAGGRSACSVTSDDSRRTRRMTPAGGFQVRLLARRIAGFRRHPATTPEGLPCRRDQCRQARGRDGRRLARRSPPAGTQR